MTGCVLEYRLPYIPPTTIEFIRGVARFLQHNLISFWKAIMYFRETCAIIIEASSRVRDVVFFGGGRRECKCSGIVLEK